jgi:hypothetical protein
VRELDRGVPDGTGTAGDQDDPPRQRPRREPGRAVLVHRERAVRGERRHPEARPDREVDAVGQRHHPRRRQHHVLLRRATGLLVLGEVEPDAVADGEVGDVPSDLVDDPRAVLVRHDLGEVAPAGAAGAGLPVGGVHAGDGDAHADLAGTRSGGFPLHDREDGGGPGRRVDDCSHAAGNPAGGRCIPRAAQPAGLRTVNRSS